MPLILECFSKVQASDWYCSPKQRPFAFEIATSHWYLDTLGKEAYLRLQYQRILYYPSSTSQTTFGSNHQYSKWRLQCYFWEFQQLLNDSIRIEFLIPWYLRERRSFREDKLIVCRFQLNCLSCKCRLQSLVRTARFLALLRASPKYFDPLSKQSHLMWEGGRVPDRKQL